MTKVNWKFNHPHAEKRIKDVTGKILSVICLHMQRDIVYSFTEPGPSKKGQPPGVVTGNLRAATLWELDNGASSVKGGDPKGATKARIGTAHHAKYGHELETERSRAYLVPALRRMLGSVKSVVK